MVDQRLGDPPLHDLEPNLEGEATLVQGAVVVEALRIIDEALSQMMQRELVSSGEVADLLLDVRMLLTTKP
jgi:hypothetical protein